MKKLVVVVLAMVMVFTLVACGNNDANNAKVQAAFDKEAAVVQQLYDYYNDNGLLGDDADPATVDSMNQILANQDTVKASIQEILDKGGFNDDETATMLAAIDADTATYTADLASVQ